MNGTEKVVKYYMIENNFLRLVPEPVEYTFMNFHIKEKDLNTSSIKHLSSDDLSFYTFGDPFPNRRDNMLVRSKKSREIFILRNGHRHSIPDVDTFYSMKLDFKDVLILSESDVDQIPLGHSLPSVHNKQQSSR